MQETAACGESAGSKETSLQPQLLISPDVFDACSPTTNCFASPDRRRAQSPGLACFGLAAAKLLLPRPQWALAQSNPILHAGQTACCRCCVACCCLFVPSLFSPPQSTVSLSFTFNFTTLPTPERLPVRPAIPLVHNRFAPSPMFRP